MARAREANELQRVLASCRGYLVAAGGFSCAINLLYLASPLYMLQVYNRVVTSGSQITLVLLTVILLIAFAALSLLDTVRSRILNRMGIRLDQLLADKVFAASFRQSVRGGPRGQAIRDFDAFRQFLSSGSVNALLDLPWVPLYIVVAFFMHPFIGAFTLGCCLILVTLAISNEFLLSTPMRQANEAALRSHSFAEMSLRNAEVVQAMGMSDGVVRRWTRDRERFMERQIAAGDRGAGMGSLIRFLRLSMQSLVLGLGALLAIERLASPGTMFASNFLLGRALQPIEQVVGAWRNIVAARVAYLRIRELMETETAPAEWVELPRPNGELAVEALHYSLPGADRFALRAVTFKLKPGELVGVVGPSGAGKSTLARLLVGVLRPSAGVVRLDNADIQSWPRTLLGRHIGYLPQDVELFADTIAANISRFTLGADADTIKAAEMAGVHEMILRLPQGYETNVGDGGAVLSGGLRQRIGLARAVFGVPSLVVLDEPSSNLDSDGDEALAACFANLKALGTTVVVISHRPVTLGGADKILYLKAGRVEAFGPQQEIAARLMRRPPNAAATTELANG